MLLISIWDIYWMGCSSFFFVGLPTSMANGFVRTYLNMGVCPQKLQSWFLNAWFRTMESFGVPVLVSRTIRGGSDQGWCVPICQSFLLRENPCFQSLNSWGKEHKLIDFVTYLLSKSQWILISIGKQNQNQAGWTVNSTPQDEPMDYRGMPIPFTPTKVWFLAPIWSRQCLKSWCIQDYIDNYGIFLILYIYISCKQSIIYQLYINYRSIIYQLYIN